MVHVQYKQSQTQTILALRRWQRLKLLSPSSLQCMQHTLAPCPYMPCLTLPGAELPGPRPHPSRPDTAVLCRYTATAEPSLFGPSSSDTAADARLHLLSPAGFSRLVVPLPPYRFATALTTATPPLEAYLRTWMPTVESRPMAAHQPPGTCCRRWCRMGRTW